MIGYKNQFATESSDAARTYCHMAIILSENRSYSLLFDCGQVDLKLDAVLRDQTSLLQFVAAEEMVHAEGSGSLEFRRISRTFDQLV